MQHDDTKEKSEAENSDDPQPFQTMKRHPDRENMINDMSQPTQAVSSQLSDSRPQPNTGPSRRQRPIPFHKESLKARSLRAEAEERRRGREEAELQRTQKLQERQQMRKAMAKARTGGRNGQRKLGRESKILLEKVKKAVAEP